MRNSHFVLVLSCLAAFAVSFVAVAASMPHDAAPSSAREGVTHRTHDTTLPSVGDLDLSPRVVTIPTVVIVASRRAVKAAPKAAPLAWGCRPADPLLSDYRATARACGWFPVTP